MSIRISDMDAAASVDGTELLPASVSGAPKSVTPAVLKNYVVDQIEAISAGDAVAGDDQVYILDATDSTLKPVDVDLVAQHAIDTIWGKAAETSPDDADVLAMKDGGTTEKTVTLAYLAEYVRETIESSILDISDLSDGSGTLASSDYILVTQGSTAKRIQVSDLSTSIYSALATHVTGLSDVGTGDDADVLYMVRGSTAYKITLAEIATHVESGLSLSGSGTADYLAEWSDSDTLTTGPALIESTTGFSTGSNAAVPTTAAVRGEMDTIIYDSTDIGADLSGTDTILVDDGAAGTTQRKSAISRVWTYVLTLIAARTDVSSDAWVLDEDAMGSDDATKVPTQQSVKAYVDSAVADIAISGINLDGGTDIGGDLADADLLLVDDGAGGTNRKSALSRVWTYVQAKIVALTDVSSHGWVLDEDAMGSDDATKVPTQQSVKAYVDTEAADVTNLNLDGAADIGEALADADLLLVDNGAGGTNVKSAVSRVWTYVSSKITGAPLDLPTYAVAGLPAATTPGQIIYCSDGAGGNPCLAFSDGSNWCRCDTLATVSAT